MPRIILKSNYLKAGSSNVAGFVRYIATRDSVEKYTNDSKLLPATKKQKQTIDKMLKLFPDSATLFEYEDYQQTLNRTNASAFLSACAEYYILPEQNEHPELYAQYIATRPNSEKINSHGLFGMEEDASLANTMEELKNHKGNVWTHIVSIRREDAHRLGYESVTPWRNLARSHAIELANQMKIKPQNLKWYGAFHNESHHPHMHLIVYSQSEREGFLTKKGIYNLRSAFAKTIFKHDLISIYEKQTSARDNLSDSLKQALDELEMYIQSGSTMSEPMKRLFLELCADLSERKGKKVYGYLPKVLKSKVDALLDLFAEDKIIASCYQEWNALRQEVLGTYSDKKMDTLPLSAQKEFIHLKNSIIKSAVEYVSPAPPEMLQDVSDLMPNLYDLPQDVNANKSYSSKDLRVSDISKPKGISDLWSKGYKQCRAALYQERDFKKAHDLLLEECKANNPLAFSDLARLYADGLGVEINPEKADVYYQTALTLFLEHPQNKKSDYLQYRIGKMYLYGLGTEVDYRSAEQWLGKASEKGNKYAQYTLGMMYFRGTDVEKDILKAMELLKESADQNNPYAQFQYGLYLKETMSELEYLHSSSQYLISAYKGFVKLESESEDDMLSYRVGKMLEQGIGVTQNKILALEYFKKSAELKNPHALIAVIKYMMDDDLVNHRALAPYLKTLQELADNQNELACYFLGTLLEHGEVLPKDDTLAIKYYSSIAENHSHAAYRLGRLLLESQQVPHDIDDAVQWLEKSVGMGNDFAAYYLGKMYAEGNEVEQNVDKAIYYLESASNQNESACYLLGKLYDQGELVKRDEKKAFELYAKIAKKNEFASYRLGNLIINTQTLPINPSIGIYWLENAAAFGNQYACNKLGYYYLKGDLIPRDVEKALNYFEKSIGQQNSYAFMQLGRMYLYGIGVPKDVSSGLRYLEQAVLLGCEPAREIANHYHVPREQHAYSSILRSFATIFAKPPEKTDTGASPRMVDRKQRSKTKRKNIALGHAKDDEMTMKES